MAGPVTIPLVLGWPLAGLRAEGEGPAVRLLSLFLLAPWPVPEGPAGMFIWTLTLERGALPLALWRLLARPEGPLLVEAHCCWPGACCCCWPVACWKLV